MSKSFVKGVNIVAQVALIAYFSGVGAFIMPVSVNAQESTIGLNGATLSKPPTDQGVLYLIHGFVGDDIDMNGAWESSTEPGQGGVIVTIEGNGVSRQTTSNNVAPVGRYEFKGLRVGTYTICEDISADTNKVQTYPTNPACHEVTIEPIKDTTHIGPVMLGDYNFGNYTYGAINVNKWEDKNANTVWEPSTEDGLESWTINLMTNCSSNLSHYDYDNLSNPKTVTLADFTMFGQLYSNKDDSADLSQDGYVSLPDLKCFNYVFTHFDDEEPYDNITPSEPLVLDTQMTNSVGAYAFTGLEPGTYMVNEVMQVDWAQSFPGDNQPVSKTVTSGASLSQDFGNYQPAEEEEEEDDPVEVTPVIRLDLASDQDMVPAGSNVVYTVDWAVVDADVTNLVLKAELPENTGIVSVMDSAEASIATVNNGEYDLSTNMVTWELGNKAVGTSGIATYTVSVDSNTADGTVLESVATLNSNETEAVSASVLVDVSNTPMLTLVKSVDKTLVSPGDSINYTVEVINEGYADAVNVQLIDELDSELYYGDVLGNTRTLSSSGNLAVGDSMSFTYPVTVKSGTKTGTYSNSATLTADNHGTITATAPVTVQAATTVEEVLPSLGVNKSVDAPFANPGDTVNYTVTITNNGDGRAVNTVLTDTLPVGFTFAETGGDNRTWKLGDLEAGESTTVTYASVIDASVTANTYNNVATVSADNHDEVTATIGLEVREAEVLGAETVASGPETLAETSTGTLDYLMMALAGMVLAGAGFLLIRQREYSRT
ncbi:DUF11 domain-containing protein [Patescibacteria group bacterium]|nr:DUF11 domain-containing protein [Patescibacteria group bacterium]MBU1890379.1 DUF11 domain-containing protein [Patescibacteria group bacterium]